MFASPKNYPSAMKTVSLEDRKSVEKFSGSSLGIDFNH